MYQYVPEARSRNTTAELYWNVVGIQYSALGKRPRPWLSSYIGIVKKAAFALYFAGALSRQLTKYGLLDPSDKRLW